jgi:hypothetical protein
MPLQDTETTRVESHFIAAAVASVTVVGAFVRLILRRLSTRVPLYPQQPGVLVPGQVDALQQRLLHPGQRHPREES